jgi:hypothetical protein
MHAVVVRVNIGDVDSAEKALRGEVVPRISQAPGFVAGYWTRKDDKGLSMIIFETEEDANRASEMVRSMGFDFVSLEDVEVREVVAHA